MNPDFKEWFESKLGKSVGNFIGQGVDGAVYELDPYRVIKIKSRTDDLDPLLSLSQNPIPGVVRVFSVGKIQLPKRFWRQFDENQEIREAAFVIMEKLFPSQDLENKLTEIGKLWKEFAKQTGAPRYGMGIHVLRDLAINEDKEALKEFANFINDEHPELIQVVLEIYSIFQALQANGINWADVHSKQFAYNKKGQIKAFDIDYRGNEHLGLDAAPENLMATKTNLKEYVSLLIRGL